MSRKTKQRGSAKSTGIRSQGHFDINDAPRVAKPLSLTCGACGKSGKYHVGTVMLDPTIAGSSDEGSFSDAIAFTGYFRCRSCGAGGPWELPDHTFTYLMAMAAVAALGAEDVPFLFGGMATFDKRVFRYATECEAHLKELIDREPERAFLWVRLGNVYSKGEEHERAETAYRRAIELDPKDIEAQGMLGQLLMETGRVLDSVPCWHAVLSHARDARHLKKDMLRNIVHVAIECLLEAHAESKGQIDLLPKMDSIELAKRSKDEPAVFELLEFDLGSEEGIGELCDVFLGHRQRRWRDLLPRLKRQIFDAQDERIAAPLRREAATVGRNQPCPCGSGHKYKKCCGRRPG